jgi:hypothetical protein
MSKEDLDSHGQVGPVNHYHVTESDGKTQIRNNWNGQIEFESTNKSLALDIKKEKEKNW